jgi:hypothetical protein
MTLSRKLKIAAFALIAGFAGLQAADRFVSPGSFSVISTAEAIIGRPLTPLSVAGVARRTVRRCAVGIYYC